MKKEKNTTRNKMKDQKDFKALLRLQKVQYNLTLTWPARLILYQCSGKSYSFKDKIFNLQTARRLYLATLISANTFDIWELNSGQLHDCISAKTCDSQWDPNAGGGGGGGKASVLKQQQWRQQAGVAWRFDRQLRDGEKRCVKGNNNS